VKVRNVERHANRSVPFERPFMFVIAAFAAACGDDVTEAANTVQVDTLDSGAVLIRNAPLDPELPPAGWGMRELLRLGSIDGVNETGFARVVGVDIDDSGNVYVLDSQHGEIRVFAADGKYLRTIGRRGSGPGEFRNPDGLVIAADGRLWVRDWGNQSYTTFELGGALAESYRWRFGGGRWSPVIGQDGTLWETVTLSLDLGTLEARQALVALAPATGGLEVLDTVVLPPPIPVPVWQVEPQTTGGVVEGGMVRVPFSPETRHGVDPRGGYWTGRTDALRFIYHAPSGDTIRIIERVAPPREVSAEDRDRALQELEARFANALRADASQIPAQMPFWNALLVDPSGRLWVERYRPPGTPAADSRLWEIYDPQGVYLGVIDLGVTSTPRPRMRGDRIVGTVQDELDVFHVVVIELRTD
jgi:hypothetical protein